MNKSYGVKPVFALLGIFFVLGLLISAARMIFPAPAYADDTTPQYAAASASDAATVRFVCDGGKVTTTTISKWKADWGVWNTVVVPFNCAVLTATYVTDGYDIKYTADFLPGQNPTLPRVADTIATVVRKQ